MQQFLLLYSSPNGLENGRSLRDNLEQQNEDGDRFFFFFFLTIAATKIEIVNSISYIQLTRKTLGLD